MDEIFLVIRFSSVFDRIQHVNSTEATIGRDVACEICLSDPLVSRKHAQLFRTEKDWRIRDLNSRNGTHCNGTPLCAEERLFDGSEIQLGSCAISVCSSIAKAVKKTAINDDSTQSKNVGHDLNETRLKILTPAQRRVFELLVQGLIEKEVAAQLGISTHTVHDHVKAIYKTLSVSTRGELVSRWATKHG